MYVDNDPLVITHARALLTSTREGACNYIEADLHDPANILRRARSTLGFNSPVAIMLLSIMHFVPADDEAYEIIRHLLDAVPSGSFLVMSHGSTSFQAEGMRESERRWNAGGGKPPIHMRTLQEVAPLFDGLELLDPGLVSVSQWRPAPGAQPDEVGMCAAVGRKP